MRDPRIGLDLFTDVLDVLHQHGFTRCDDQHADRAIVLIGDLARIDEGTQDHPYGPSIHQEPTPPPPGPPGPPGPDSRDAVVIPVSERKTVLIALDIGAGEMRDRAGMCTGCPGRSCPACQSAAATPRPTTSWPTACSRPPAPPRPLTTARPGRPAPPGSPASQRARKPASDPTRQATRRTRRPPPSRRSPGPGPAAGRRGSARAARPYDLPIPTTPTSCRHACRERDSDRPAPRLAARRTPSLAELLESIRTREPEPDPEAEP